LQCISFVYNPKLGDPESETALGTKIVNLPDSWMCPLCGGDKDMFSGIIQNIEKQGGIDDFG